MNQQLLQRAIYHDSVDLFIQCLNDFNAKHCQLSQFIYKNAIRTNNEEHEKYTYAIYHTFKTMCEQACISICTYMIHNVSCKTNPFDEFSNNMYPENTYVIESIVKSINSVSLMQEVFGHIFIITSRDINKLVSYACRYDNLSLIKYVYDKYEFRNFTKQHIIDCILNNSTSIFMYICDMQPVFLPDIDLTHVTSRCRLDGPTIIKYIIKYRLQNNLSIQWYDVVLNLSALSHYLSLDAVFKMMQTNGVVLLDKQWLEISEYVNKKTELNKRAIQQTLRILFKYGSHYYSRNHYKHNLFEQCLAHYTDITIMQHILETNRNMQLYLATVAQNTNHAIMQYVIDAMPNTDYFNDMINSRNTEDVAQLLPRLHKNGYFALFDTILLECVKRLKNHHNVHVVSRILHRMLTCLLFYACDNNYVNLFNTVVLYDCVNTDTFRSLLCHCLDSQNNVMLTCIVNYLYIAMPLDNKMLDSLLDIHASINQATPEQLRVMLFLVYRYTGQNAHTNQAIAKMAVKLGDVDLLRRACRHIPNKSSWSRTLWVLIIRYTYNEEDLLNMRYIIQNIYTQRCVKA